MRPPHYPIKHLAVFALRTGTRTEIGVVLIDLPVFCACRATDKLVLAEQPATAYTFAWPNQPLCGRARGTGRVQ